MAGLAAVGMIIAPVVAKEFPGRSVNPWEVNSPSSVLSASTGDPETDTLVSDKVRDKVVEYIVQEGDTVSTIAEKFGISIDTIRWQNNLATKASIKVGQTLQILPVTGVSHKVQKGDTVYSIAKYYDTSAQAVVDFPYNTFSNDETFELAIGQTIIVPDGVKPAEVLWSPLARVKQTTPNAGTVVASGIFVWPTSGTITQNYVWYHLGIDIANHGAPSVLAADAGTVLVPPYMSGGYGNYVIIDHGNGYRTLYGHMNVISVVSGQTVRRGDVIGKMGSTGRSTGIHCHFEVSLNGVRLNPLSILR
jgi:murein DD-endopeptidase MepM/ murein hydrolase activator NlpD